MTTSTMDAPVAPAPVAPARGLGLVDALLRDRAAFIARLDAGEDLAAVARTMIVTIAFGAGVFGAALGLYHGGLQTLFAAVKLPLVVLLTAAICAPVATTVKRVVVGSADLLRDLALVLSALALTSLIMAALAPLVLLAVTFELAYLDLFLLVVLASGLAGVAGLAVLWPALASRARPLVTGAVLLAFCLVGTQLGWTLRPFLVRPGGGPVPFVRTIESSFVEAVGGALTPSRPLFDLDVPRGDERWDEAL